MGPTSDVFEELRRLRTVGTVRCGTTRASALNAASAAFGLEPRAGHRQFEDAAARMHLVWALHRDLAHGAEAMPLEDAKRLADAFFAACPSDCRFFTNGRFDAASRLCEWSPATSATFDTGVVAIGESGAAYVWIEDED